ncbi:hypothetical protein [Niallia taxi]|uniref:hypothetical protein n=1 Tax=Niallia taxi TaxID=2499688 RepID=UPI0030097016
MYQILNIAMHELSVIFHLIRNICAIYSATKGVSAAEHAMSAYKNVRSFSTLEKTEMGIYGLISANGLSEYLTGKDVLGNELTDEQRHASLSQGIFAGLPFAPHLPGMMKKADRLSQEAVNRTVQLGKQGMDITRAWADDVAYNINPYNRLVADSGVVRVNTDSGAINSITKPESRDKVELLSMLSGGNGGSARYRPGVVNESFNFDKALEGQTKLMYNQASIGVIPKEVRDQLIGKEFNSFDDFRNEFWKSVANSSFASEFNPRNVARMAAGNAPIALKVEHYGKHKSYILHHKQPIDKGGEVYNLDNLMITFPRMHQIILDPAYHFGKKGN